MRYAVVDSDGNVVNVVIWDGESDWSPPEDCTVIPHETAGRGGTLIDGKYTTPEGR